MTARCLQLQSLWRIPTAGCKLTRVRTLTRVQTLHDAAESAAAQRAAERQAAAAAAAAAEGTAAGLRVHGLRNQACATKEMRCRWTRQRLRHLFSCPAQPKR